jgi:hypothetical protein
MSAADYKGISPETALLATMERHVSHVRDSLARIRHELELRGIRHDRSKYSSEEFPGFARINATARRHPYGSDEYKASLAAERPTVERHTRENSHHPEAHDERWRWPERVSIIRYEQMPWLDIIEMVCDWRAAWEAYGKQGTWEGNIVKQRERFPEGEAFTEGQWWLIFEVADWLDEGDDR